MVRHSVGQGMVQRPQNMQRVRSMSKRVTRIFISVPSEVNSLGASLGLRTRSMEMQLVGQTTAQLSQPMQSSILQNKRPRNRLARFNFSVGYWTVIGTLTRCFKVTRIPIELGQKTSRTSLKSLRIISNPSLSSPCRRGGQ